jgi:hypothetical protein
VVGLVAGSVPGWSVVNEVKAIDQALVALPTLGRRNAGSGAWHSRSSVAPGEPDSEEDALPDHAVQQVWASPEPIGRRIALLELDASAIFYAGGVRIRSDTGR